MYEKWRFYTNKNRDLSQIKVRFKCHRVNRGIKRTVLLGCIKHAHLHHDFFLLARQHRPLQAFQCAGQITAAAAVFWSTSTTRGWSPVLCVYLFFIMRPCVSLCYTFYYMYIFTYYICIFKKCYFYFWHVLWDCIYYIAFNLIRMLFALLHLLGDVSSLYVDTH